MSIQENSSTRTGMVGGAGINHIKKGTLISFCGQGSKLPEKIPGPHKKPHKEDKVITTTANSL